MSTVKVREAGVASALPARSTARTSNDVQAVGQRVDGVRRGAGRVRAAVDAALEARAGLARLEREASAWRR